MATYRGNSGVVKAGSAVGEVMEFSVEETSAITPDTVMGDDWETHMGGLKSYTASISCRFDHADTGQVALKIGDSVSLELFPTGETSTNQKLAGTATVTSVNQNQSYENTTVMRSFQLTGSGALVKTIIPE